MFGKKSLVDVKKSTAKLQDPKKDTATRIKHLKLILDNVDTAEAKGLFEANFSHVYNILYESFLQMETNLRQRELSFHLVHKAHKEELECTLWILERVICLLPELIHRRWQLHSLGRMLAKLLHSGNSVKLRKQGIKYFLMWYQALNENAPEYVHKMFAALVPGFNNQLITASPQTSGSIFHDAQYPVNVPEMLPILLPSNNEKIPDHVSRFYLDCLLDNLIHTVIKLEWQDKSAYHHRCFQFLLEQFKIYYLPKICPSFSNQTSLYKPNLELPLLRKMENETDLVFCRVTLIMWLTSYMHPIKKQTAADLTQSGGGGGHQPITTTSTNTNEDDINESTHPSLDSNISSHTKTTSDEDLAYQIVRDVLCSSRDNVNFVHELYRQALLLNFNHVIAIRKIISVYKDIIQGTIMELPLYALEPPDDQHHHQQQQPQDTIVTETNRRLRTDSYLGAIHNNKDNVLIRGGLQNVYQLFMTHASNVFLLEVNPHIPRLLEEQTDACKRVLNIYRFMVMNVRMDSNTWEQLLLVLLQITSLVLGQTQPKKKTLSLGGKLAPAIFQTLIVTWIKANLNVAISRELWDQFLDVLTSLTNWEELIKEWAKTMETLTRVLARHVYNLDLTNLPLDRLNEQKSKRTRRTINSQQELSSSTTISATGTVPSNHSITNSTQSSANSQITEPLRPLSVTRQDSTLTDGGSGGGGNILFSSTKQLSKSTLVRSLSETSLNVKTRTSAIKRLYSKHRRSRSLESFQPPLLDSESTDRTRSPSPAPSSGIESNSIKDSPIQVDVLSEHSAGSMDPSVIGENRGVICGGTVRGWLPDVAVILWKRMLGALGDINQITDPKLHAQVFEYLIKLMDILIKIKKNQGVSLDNLSTPQAPEFVPPITLILPWCFGALCLPDRYEMGKLNALRLLITIILNCDIKYINCLSEFYCFVHKVLIGSSKSMKNTSIKYLGPRFLSLQLPGSTLLLLDIVHACNDILNTTDKLDTVPKTEAVSILNNLLCLPDDLSSISVLQVDPQFNIMNRCPDIKENIVSILLKIGRKEPFEKARCIALTGLSVFVYKELINQTFHLKIVEAVNVLLGCLKSNHKTIVKLSCDIFFFLCDHAGLLWTRYPRLGNAVISELCGTLLKCTQLEPKSTTECDRALYTSLLLCLGEWCMKLGPERLSQQSEYGENRGSSLLLQVFTVLHKIVSNPDRINSPTGSNSSTDTLNSPNHPSHSHHHRHYQRISSPSKANQKQYLKAIKLCAETVLVHLINHLGHFPMAIGAARLNSMVAENDDVPNLSSDDLSNDIFSVPNIQMFILSKNVIASLIELPTLDTPGGGATADLITADKQVRVLLRDMAGKASWDASILYRTPDANQELDELEPSWITDESNQNTQLESFMPTTLTTAHNLPQRAMRHRPPNVLPDVSNRAPDLDQLDDLLQYIGYTSPECLEHPNRKLNEPGQSPLPSELEQEIIASIVCQRNTEIEHVRGVQHLPSMAAKAERNPRRFAKKIKQQDGSGGGGGYCSDTSSLKQGSVSSNNYNDNETNAFQQCRLLFSQLGLAGWDRRRVVHLLDKNDRLLRELRNLDNQSCRETHKFAVIYVAPGQEDKTSILSNQSGSMAYETFLAALAWEIELEYHTGFLGGLPKQGSTGMTAPYYATSFMEAIFHVATRMPGDNAEAVLNKTRHLGNDEVHIVWSEHYRDYRRDILPTEFCDILIVIYPLGNNLNRISISSKPDVPYFGVLFDEAIVESNILAGLIRATAVCASRAKRITYQFYQQYYEERANSLETVVTKHKQSTTYEEFIAKVYNPITMQPTTTSANSSSFRTRSATSSADGTSFSTLSSSSQLAMNSGVLDSYLHSKGQQRNIEHHKYKSHDSVRNVWINQTIDAQNQVVETSISPRPFKKLSVNLKSSSKKLLTKPPDQSSTSSSAAAAAAESPPESPIQMTRRK